jgi:hypothetical protein
MNDLYPNAIASQMDNGWELNDKAMEKRIAATAVAVKTKLIGLVALSVRLSC